MKKFLSIVIFLVSLLPGILSGSTYLVDVTVECENEEAAYSAYLKFLPLPQGKEVAFSCRWDDSSLGHAALVPLLKKYGYKATFYLHESGKKAFWQKVFPQLYRDGFTVGNHTRGHKELPRLSANGIHYEIMAWKMLLEYRSDQCVTTFIVPYGKINSPYFPGVDKLIGSILRRAGIYGGSDFSPEMYRFYGTDKRAYFSGAIVRPGDRNTKMDKFDADVKRHLAAGAEHLSLGIHPWHSPADLKVLDACLKKYAFNPRWWYCNENDYIAYKFLFHNAKVVRKVVKGKIVHFQVELPSPGRLGSDTALDALCAGKVVSIRHTEKLPEKIGIASSGNGLCAKFPGVRAFLKKGGDNTFRLELANNGAPLEDVKLTVILPPVFKDEQQVLSCGKVEKSLNRSVYKYTRRDPARESSGRELTAVAVDFVREGKAGRLWVQHIEEIKHPAGTYPLYYRYAALDKNGLLALSCGKGDLRSFTAVQSKPEQRAGIFSLRPEPDWKTLPLIAVVEFTGGRSVTLCGELPPEVIINGKVFKTSRNQVKFSAPAGRCRAVMCIPPGVRMLREIAVMVR